MRFRKTSEILIISLFMLILVAPQSFAKRETTQAIRVVVGSNCTCGNHYGEFDTMYKGKKMSVGFNFNSNAANPMEHPLKVFRGKREVKDWPEILCGPTPIPSKVMLTGKQVTVEGQFKNRTTFEAYKIYVTPDENKNIQNGITERFKIFDNGTVLDTQTKLMWANEDNQSDISWEEAKIYCKNYRGGGYNDWRMPTQKELSALYESTKRKGNFPRGCNNGRLMDLIHLTSCSPWASERRTDKAAVVNLANGSQFFVTKMNQYEWNKGRVLPVRSVK